VRDCAGDSSQHVRAALATQISGLAPLLGKDSTVEHLLPLFLQLLKDDFSEVRLNLISKLEMVNSGECWGHECGKRVRARTPGWAGRKGTRGCDKRGGKGRRWEPACSEWGFEGEWGFQREDATRTQRRKLDGQGWCEGDDKSCDRLR
jgi:hypothetical protein